MNPMTEEDWRSVAPLFTKDEFIHEQDSLAWQKIDRSVVLLLYQMRDWAKCPFVVHKNGAYAPNVGHASNSYHYQGLAVDGHFVGMPLFDQLLIALSFSWTGVGFYPFWSHPGLHLDLRPLPPSNSIKMIWFQNSIGEYIYLHKEKANFGGRLLISLPLITDVEKFFKGG